MSQLVDSYIKSGLVPDDPTKYFETCDACGESFHPDDLNTVDIEDYGKHYTIAVCDGCKDDPDPVDLTGADCVDFDDEVKP